MKIVVTQNMGLSEDQKARLEKVGEVIYFDDLAKDGDEWLRRCKGADVVLSGKWGMKEKLLDLENVFLSFCFVGYGWVDLKKCREKNIKISYSPGCNKNAVSEWMIGFMINLLRRQCEFINTEKIFDRKQAKTIGLKDKKVCVLGKGNIGNRIGKVCEAFEMSVRYFDKGDSLFESIREADVVFNCLSLNPTTEKLLDEDFFKQMKENSYFISVTSDKVFDTDGLIKYLDNGHLAGAGIDTGSVQIGDVKNEYYKKLAKHPKVLATSHVAYCTDVSNYSCNNMMIANVETWARGKQINVVA